MRRLGHARILRVARRAPRFGRAIPERGEQLLAGLETGRGGPEPFPRQRQQLSQGVRAEVLHGAHFSLTGALVNVPKYGAAVSDLPRLLLCCFDVIPAPTAISRRLTEYVKGLSDRYQVIVLTVKTPDHTHIERYHGARLLRVPVGAGDLAARVQAFDRAVRRQLDSEEYVMVHFFDPFSGYALCERRGDFGFKLVYDACSLPSVELPLVVSEAEANRRFIAKVRRQELFCLMNADVVVVANELTRDFVSGLGVPREQVQVLPAPVDLGPYDPALMGVPDATPMKLLHLGNQSHGQDLPTLLEAMQLALQTVDVRLTIVGPKIDEHQARLEEQVVALKLTGKVEFQPPVTHDDVHKVIAAADVGVLTLSDVERNSKVGSPLSRLGEYLAAGRPVIAADVASARALLPEDGVVLYRPQDKQSLADAIVSLATEPNRRVKLGAAARSASLDRDAAKIRADLVAIYVALTGTGARAVGDADATTPDEPTQLGASALGSEDTSKRRARAKKEAKGESPSGTNKVKTDPALAVQDTAPEAQAGSDRPAVMGVPLRDDPPVVIGQELKQELQQELRQQELKSAAAELAQVSTEPNARLRSEPPVVMGMPLAEAPKEKRETYTPGDLAAELGEIEASVPALDAPTSPVPDEPRHLDDAPKTGSHLSLVPPAAQSLDDEPMPRVPTRSPELDEPPASPPTPLPPPPVSAPPTVIPPLEMPPPLSSSPSGLTSPPPIRSSPSGLTAPPPLPPRPAAPSAPPPSPAAGVPLLTVPPLPQRSTGSFPVVPAGPPQLPPSKPGTPGSSGSTGSTGSTSSSGSTGSTGSSGSSGSFAAFNPAQPPVLKSGTSGAHNPAVPPPLKPSVSGSFPVIPAGPAGPPAPPKTTVSGTFPVIPAGAAPPPPKPSGSSGTFVPYNPPQRSSPSGTFSSMPTPVPETTLAGALSAPPVRPPRGATGLFPEAPSVPEKAEEIDESEIEQVSEGVEGAGTPADSVEEVGADEIVEVGGTPARGSPRAAPAPRSAPIAGAPAPTPAQTGPAQTGPAQTGPSATSDDAPVMAEESVTTVDTDPSLPQSAINPWLAQLVHGYCPPESGLFERHTPPTTMPGRDT